MEITRKLLILLALVAMSLATAQAEKQTMDVEEMISHMEGEEVNSEEMESLKSDHQARRDSRKMGRHRGGSGGGWGWGWGGGWGGYGGWGYPYYGYGYYPYYVGMGYPYGGFGYGRFLRKQ